MEYRINFSKLHIYLFIHSFMCLYVLFIYLCLSLVPRQENKTKQNKTKRKEKSKQNQQNNKITKQTIKNQKSKTDNQNSTINNMTRVSYNNNMTLFTIFKISNILFTQTQKDILFLDDSCNPSQFNSFLCSGCYGFLCVFFVLNLSLHSKYCRDFLIQRNCLNFHAMIYLDSVWDHLAVGTHEHEASYPSCFPLY